MLRRSAKKRLVADINVVPYIDVMLVLLVIFMVTAPLLEQGVSVDLPSARAMPIAPSEKEAIVVSLNKEGLLFINISEHPSKAITQTALTALLSQELQQDPTRKVLLKGDRSVDYGQIMGVMVQLQKAGASSVGLISQDV